MLPEFEESHVTRKTKRIYISTVISMSLMLLMVGVMGMIAIHAKNLAAYVQENIVIGVFFNENAQETDVWKLQKALEKQEMVKKTTYISKETAAKVLQKDLGEDFILFLGYNPLPYSIDVFLKSTHASKAKINDFIAETAKNPLIKTIKYQETLLENLTRHVKTASFLILGFAALLLFLSVVLINNTIHLAIFSERFLIKSMQLVGATASFIRWPYLKTSILQSLFAALLAILGVIGLLLLAQKQVPQLIALQNIPHFLILFCLMLIFGILIGVVSSGAAVSRYLRCKQNALYL